MMVALSRAEVFFGTPGHSVSNTSPLPLLRLAWRDVDIQRSRELSTRLSGFALILQPPAATNKAFAIFGQADRTGSLNRFTLAAIPSQLTTLHKPTGAAQNASHNHFPRLSPP
jgi:hypothetical protein